MSTHTRVGTSRAVLGLVALGLVVAACSEHNEERGRGDAPVGEVDDTPAAVMNFPDQFRNVAFKCNGPHGVYSNTDGHFVVVEDDENCSRPAG